MSGADAAGADDADARAGTAELIVVEPVRVDSRRILLVLTALWLLGLIALSVLWPWLGHHGHRAWFWTAVDGTVLGLLGLILAGRHRDAGRTD